MMSKYIFNVGQHTAPNAQVKLTIANAARIFKEHPHWQGVWRYNEFACRMLAVNPPMRLDAETNGLSSDHDIPAIISWFQCLPKSVETISRDGEKVQKTAGHTMNANDCFAAIRLACEANRFHPVKKYLEGLQGGAPWALESFSELALGVKDPLAQEACRKFLIGAVRRIYQPGCQMDNMLTFYGKQGKGKSTIIPALFGKEVSTAMQADLAGKDASDSLHGFWVVEMEELNSILRVGASTAKAFLSRRVDTYRPAYGKTNISFPRQCVFIGTTNIPDFLRDSTGDRRYWPIETQRIDIDWTTKHRDEIWAEAFRLSKTDEPHYFVDESVLEEQRSQFREVDPWTDAVEDICAGREYTVGSTPIILRIGVPLDRITNRERQRVCDILRRLGCVPYVRRINGEVKKVWLMSEDLRLKTPTKKEQQYRCAEEWATNVPTN